MRAQYQRRKEDLTSWRNTKRSTHFRRPLNASPLHERLSRDLSAGHSFDLLCVARFPRPLGTGHPSSTLPPANGLISDAELSRQRRKPYGAYRFFKGVERRVHAQQCRTISSTSARTDCSSRDV